MRHYLGGLILITAFVGCDKANQVGDSRSMNFNSTPVTAANAIGATTAAAEKISVQSDTASVTSVNAFSSIGNNSYMMKNYLQLQTAMTSCLGPGLGTITDDMFTVGICPNTPTYTIAADKTAILSPTLCASKGMNILSVDKAQLWDPAQVGRTVTLANNLTPGYLTALAQAADVYAHGVSNPSSLCSTPAAAQAFVQNCLGQFDPSTLTASVATIQTLCAKGPLQARQAIASVIGSVAFAVINGTSATASTGTAEAPAGVIVNTAGSGSGS